MRTTLVTAVILCGLVPTAMGERNDDPRHPGGESHKRHHGDMEGRGGPPFGWRGEMFMRMDKDGDGSITREEFFAEKWMGRLEEEKRAEIFGRLDRDGDGTISREEVKMMRKDAERRARDEFRKLDANDSGGLDFEEFSKGKFFAKLPEEKRRQIFGRMDTDGSGEITAEDRPKGPPHRKE